jgi:shikimate dehydrogenase
VTDFGLIGHPVEHSMSRIMHAAAFKELKLDYAYSLFDVQPEELELFLKNANFRGLNVTIPLKTHVVKYMDELSDEALLVGSVNTIEFKDRVIGHNTDSVGFIRSMEEEGVDIEDRRFLVLGTGGAGRSVVFKLACEKARAYVFDRKPEKSAALASEVLRRTGVRVEAAGKIEDVIRDVDVIVNATSVGMHPNVEDSLVDAELLNPAQTVVDIVYNPVQTRLLREAKARGCKTVSGVGMLVHQGAESLRIWLGVDPPIDAMRKAVLERLENRG